MSCRIACGYRGGRKCGCWRGRGGAARFSDTSGIEPRFAYVPARSLLSPLLHSRGSVAAFYRNPPHLVLSYLIKIGDVSTIDFPRQLRGDLYATSHSDRTVARGTPRLFSRRAT